jgi:hypothetical protein
VKTSSTRSGENELIHTGIDAVPNVASGSHHRSTTSGSNSSSLVAAARKHQELPLNRQKSKPRHSGKP